MYSIFVNAVLLINQIILTKIVKIKGEFIETNFKK